MQRRLPLHPPGGKRALRRAAHLRVEVRLVPLVERAAGAGAERDAEDRGEPERERRQGRCGEHAADPGKDHEAHDARLGEREDVAPVGRQGGWGRQFDGGHLPPPIGARTRGENPSAEASGWQDSGMGAEGAKKRPDCA